MTKPVTIYGISNCDTMKKARAWLDARGIAHFFHDYRVLGIDQPMIENWVRRASWESLLNKASMTFRSLPEPDKADLTQNRAIALMLAQPTLIKRPVLDTGKDLLVGFKPDGYDAALK